MKNYIQDPFPLFWNVVSKSFSCWLLTGISFQVWICYSPLPYGAQGNTVVFKFVF